MLFQTITSKEATKCCKACISWTHSCSTRIFRWIGTISWFRIRVSRTSGTAATSGTGTIKWSKSRFSRAIKLRMTNSSRKTKLRCKMPVAITQSLSSTRHRGNTYKERNQDRLIKWCLAIIQRLLWIRIQCNYSGPILWWNRNKRGLKSKRRTYNCNNWMMMITRFIKRVRIERVNWFSRSTLIHLWARQWIYPRIRRFPATFHQHRNTRCSTHLLNSSKIISCINHSEVNNSCNTISTAYIQKTASSEKQEMMQAIFLTWTVLRTVKRRKMCITKYHNLNGTVPCQSRENRKTSLRRR